MKNTLLLWILAVVNMLAALYSCQKELSCEGCTTGNRPPVAAAGSDQVISLPADSILLDGSASRDPDGTISEWLWKKVSGPSSFQVPNASIARTIVRGLVAGVYAFELRVTDNGGLFAKDTVWVTVDDPSANRPPLANAGPDTTIFLPANTVNLDGSRSTDPDNNITHYMWTKVSGPSSITIVSGANVQTQVTDLTEGIYHVQLTVIDARGLVSEDTVKINVMPGGTSELLFPGQTLLNYCYDPWPGACWINGDSPLHGFQIMDTTNTLPDFPNAGTSVWIKMDTSSVWEQAPGNCWMYPAPTPQTNFTYCLTADCLTVYSWFFSSVNLEGRKADLKIRF